MEFSALLESAMRCATNWHAEQTRKVTTVPYLTHPVNMMIILLQHGFTNENTLAAALLHDVLEDTNCTKTQLAEQFPQEVFDLVVCLSEQKFDQEGKKRSWNIHKAEHAEQLLQALLPA